MLGLIIESILLIIIMNAIAILKEDIDMEVLNLNLNKFLMEAPVTDYQDSCLISKQKTCSDFPDKPDHPSHQTSSNLLHKIYSTLNSPRNYRSPKPYKMSISIQDTNQAPIIKCNCKKSKCLKLYCQCFAQGVFCNGCNCACCHNSEEHSQIRALAIDQVMNKSLIPFGHKNSSIKGCNCKKTGCQKKYCECYNSGTKCTEYCKCCNCSNC